MFEKERKKVENGIYTSRDIGSAAGIRHDPLLGHIWSMQNLLPRRAALLNRRLF
jgi:hypothetical protein